MLQNKDREHVSVIAIALVTIVTILTTGYGYREYVNKASQERADLAKYNYVHMLAQAGKSNDEIAELLCMKHFSDDTALKYAELKVKRER